MFARRHCFLHHTNKYNHHILSNLFDVIIYTSTLRGLYMSIHINNRTTSVSITQLINANFISIITLELNIDKPIEINAIIITIIMNAHAN